MNKIKKFFNSHKKSILSFSLALILTLSFNYSPIALLANIFKTNAYKSSSVNTYYPNSSTKNETNIGSGTYPASLAAFFKNSSNNFNIKEVYDDYFEEYFAKHIHSFLSSLDETVGAPEAATKVAYKTLYAEFLKSVNKKDLYEYYVNNTSTIKNETGATTFRDYVEYFVSHNIKYTYIEAGSTEGITKYVYPIENFVHEENNHEHKSEFYHSLENFLTKTSEALGDHEVENEDGEKVYRKDGVLSGEKFYEQSVSYRLVKKYIDGEIDDIFAIFTYDGETQNKNVAAILAQLAPGSQSTYYEDKVYESSTKTSESYVTTSADDSGKRNIYYLNKKDSSTTFVSQATGAGISLDHIVFDNDGSVKTNFEKYPLLYRPIQQGEYGYVENFNTYYKYEKIPYSTLSDGNYYTYVVDDDVTPDEKATYDFLYINVISSDELEAANVDEDHPLYINLPLPNGSEVENSYTMGLHDNYFIKVLGISPTSNDTTTTSDIERFKNIIKLFKDTNGESTLYLKYSETTTNYVYIQTGKKDLIKSETNQYKYADYLKEADFEKMTDEQLNDYYEIQSGSNYYNSKYKLYFKKVIKPYQKLTAVEYLAGQYETKNVPNIPFETIDIASNEYVMDGDVKKIYAHVPNGTENTTGKTSISTDDLNNAVHNEFVKVPENIVKQLSLDETFTYYFKHTLIENTKKIYIVVNSEKYNEEKDNEVYKNLNYTVIPNKTTGGVNGYNFKEYISVEKTNPNYNENFKLYYKYVSEESLSSKIYIQNEITGKNALFVVDSSVTSSDKTTYKDSGRNFIAITKEEYEANYKFYTQITEDDENYNLKYTLYYKYNKTNQTEKVIYEYSTSSSSSSTSTYKTFSESTSGYFASDYELITPYYPDGITKNPDYVEGKNLYYKKVRGEEKDSWYTPTANITTYKYTTNSTISLSANSYYVISFYVYTNGVYTNNIGEDNELTAPMEASFYIEDTKGYINDANVKKISTNGKWEKHYLYVATHALLSSSIKLTMYMGDSNSIMGSTTGFKYANGSVMFDDIRVVKINQTDYNKLTIDNETVKTTAPEEPEENPEDTEQGEEPVLLSQTEEYVDKYGNKINVHKPELRFYDNDTILAWNGSTFDNIFNLDNLTTYFNDYNFKTNAYSTDGYTNLTDIWQMYISRNVSGQGNNYILKQYQKAYYDGKLSASIIDEKDFFEDKEKAYKDREEDKEKDDTIDSTAPKDEKEDKKYIESTFIDNNKVLKLKNSSRQLTLGLISNHFTVKQNEYYKVTVWIYSTQKDAMATLVLNSTLKTTTTQANGSLLAATANVSANILDYDKEPTNEYGWIPISFYIEGNALHSQNCNLVLSVEKDSTVYFDNITIEKITSSAYDTANSDSDKTTYCLSLTPATSVITDGVTNGYFNNVTVTDNYNSIIDYTTPRKAESWTISQTSTGVVAGAVPTSSEYLAITENFFKKYNTANAGANGESTVVPENPLRNSIYAIYSPATIKNPLNEYGATDDTNYKYTSTHSIYSSSISLSASTVYKVFFEFYKGLNFSGNMFAEIYTSSVKTENLISRLTVSADDISNSAWNEFAFYIATDASSSTIYIKIGVENAVGTCFFRNVSNKTQTGTLDKIRDDMLLDSENQNGSTDNLNNKNSFKSVKFINLNAFEFSIQGEENIDNSNTYETKEFTNNLANTSTFTTGDARIAVATFYTSSVSTSYTVTIDKVEYYIKGFEVDGQDELVYKMFSDSNYTDEVTKLNGKTVTVDGKNKVIVGSDSPTEYTITETEKTNYTYSFNDDLTLNNVFIDSSELKNDYSEKVMVLANSYSTDFTLATPKYNTTLNKTSYYVLKVYAKTSSFEDGFGLNIDLDSSISRKWTNIDTTDDKYNELRDENGFVCYQILISTNANAISTFSIKFSLGTEKSTGTGYAIIADVELEKFATEKLFKEYSLNYDDIDKESNDTVIKSFFGAESTATDTSDKKEESTEKKNNSAAKWATFFYIFSSLLLGIVIILALVATIIKKHPIKVVKQEQNDHERDSSSTISTAENVVAKKSRKKKYNDSDDQIETEEVVKKDDGFV